MKKFCALMLTVCMFAALIALPASADSVYTGAGAGKNGEGSIEVSVTLDDQGAIKEIVVTKNGDDAGISDPAVAQMPGRIAAKNSLDVDTVSGATLTSKGILSAVENALNAAGVTLQGTDDTPESTLTETEETTDVLVIGAGISGLAAALSAKENGADVIIIDKMSMPGGTTNYAGGILVCVGSELFDDSRLDSDNMDSVLSFWHNKMDYSGAESGYPDWDRLENVLADTGATVDWLVSNEIQFDKNPAPMSASYPMAQANGGGAGLIQMLAARCTALGIDLRLNCKGTSLLTDEAGAVIGATAQTPDKNIIFHAGAVILATGGISQNQDLVEKYSPKLSRAGLIPTSAPGHTGDGFLMAQAVGAGTFDVFATPLFSTTFDPELEDIGALAIYAQLGVNANGERFGNEAASAGWDTMDYTASDMIQDGNAPFWYVFDSSNADNVATLEKGMAQGIVAKGETPEDLAREMHVYTANFVKTFNDYAQAAASGEDKAFGKPAMFLQPLAVAPFYAVKVYPTTFGSAGGVTTTDHGCVTTQKGDIIPGLYAVGEMSNRYYYNENYVLAASLGLYSTMGRRAGAAAAAEALAN